MGIMKFYKIRVGTDTTHDYIVNYDEAIAQEYMSTDLSDYLESLNINFSSPTDFDVDVALRKALPVDVSVRFDQFICVTSSSEYHDPESWSSGVSYSIPAGTTSGSDYTIVDAFGDNTEISDIEVEVTFSAPGFTSLTLSTSL